MHPVVRGAGALGLAAVLATATAACESGSGSGSSSGTGTAKSGPSTASAAPATPAATTSASTTAGVPPVPASLTGQQLNWQTCPAPSTAQGGEGSAPGAPWECATLKAPLDYSKPDGQTIDLALIRAVATGTGGQPRIGSLIYNFGGPGGSGVVTLPALAKDYADLNARYDLVSFDPRGVGNSAGVRCLDDAATDASASVDGSPDDQAETTALEAANSGYTAACEKNSGAVLPHVDTVSAARDLDLLRQVLGDQKLHYFGISYGTELGGVYAHQYPGNVGHLVMDAVVDPTKDPVQSALGQAKGFQLALENFMKACAAQAGPSCPTGQGGDEGTRRITDLLNGLDTAPLPTDSDRRLTQDLAVTGIAAALYNPNTWNALSVGLQEAMQGGTGTTLLALADAYSGRDQQGHYSNQSAANRAISCADDKSRYTATDVQGLLPTFRQVSPVFGDFTAWGLTSCTGWPVQGSADLPEVSAPGSAPIVVIGNTGDPATPYEGAGAMVRQLGPGVGVEVTLQGQGHGGYDSGNACLKQAVDQYLLADRVPAEGTTCT
ncbi:alpha/beta hydrolase [Streptomyces sp. NRRL S-495]|uniref:alpha/beta hydrolase n=1 Tax=Streptomyces sp. NRRL S-495 TaxID=1609133 RepID=UPI0005F8AB81|nr:alpha/beta hydrolase [Streptomyces sp. NRRL S-495]KJY35089.1 peptidase [Streptomyces sp. NRRL S-495]